MMTILAAIKNVFKALFSDEQQGKLEAHRITDFSGRFEDWQKWRIRTECALKSAGFAKILKDENHARANTNKNRALFTHLMVATTDGTASHLVREFENMDDGHGAWKKLTAWFDGDNMKFEQSNKYRNLLSNLQLRPGVGTQIYINRFMTYTSALEEIPGEKLSDANKLQTFLGGIVDPAFNTTIKILKRQKATLSEAIAAISEEGEELKTDRKRPHHVARRSRHEYDHDYDDDDYQPRRVKPRRKKEDGSTTSIDLTPNKRGRIILSNEDWRNAPDEIQDYIRCYNARVKHGESVDDLVPPTLIQGPRRAADKSHLTAPSTPIPVTPPASKSEGPGITFYMDGAKKRPSHD